MKFKVLDSIAEIETPFFHYDSRVLVDCSDWYVRFERNVLQTESSLRIGYGRSFSGVCSIGGASLILPLRLTVARFGMKVLSSLENYYSADYRPLCSASSAREYIKPLLTQILRGENPDIISLRGLDPEAPETHLVLHALESAGWQPYQSIHQINWVHELTGDFNEYLAGRPSRLKSTLKRKTAKVMRLPGATLTVHEGRRDLGQVLQAYQHIYERSWKVPEPYPDFIPQLISSCATRGHLRMGILRVADVPVAAHFWIVKCGVAYIYKLAHDKAYDRFSPGTVLMGHMVCQAISNDGVTRLDFLTGDDDYKQDWMSVRREIIKIIAYNPSSVRAQLTRLRDEYLLPCVKLLK